MSEEGLVEPELGEAGSLTTATGGAEETTSTPAATSCWGAGRAGGLAGEFWPLFGDLKLCKVSGRGS